MTIADQITRLNNAKANIKQAIENKGITVSDSALLDEYPALINSIPMEGGDPYYEDFYNLRTNNGANMAGMFARTSGELDLRRVDVSNITNMEYMFDNSSASVNIDGWDTSNVTNMSYMFYNFTGSIDISKLDTSKVTNASFMFGNANTDKIILTGLSFPKCTKLDYMFYYATGTTLDLSSWDISNITSMSNMFAGSFKKIDLTGWKTTNVTNMDSMFYKSSNPLEELIIPDWDMTNVTSSSSFMKDSYMKNLKLIDLSRSNDATIAKIASYLPTRTATTSGTVLVPGNTSQAAYDALIAKYWRPIGAAIGSVPTSADIVAELDEIYPGKSTKVYVGTCEPWNADTSKVELVILDSSIATITEDNEVISTGVLGDITIEARIIDTQEVVGTKTISVTETDSYPNLIKFRAASTPSSYSTIITVNGSAKKLSALTYDSITDIYSYDAGAPITKIKFDGASNISELVKLNISNVTSMNNMFYSCYSLQSLNVSNWDTSNVTDMSLMFYECNKLTLLDLSNWDTSNVTNMQQMFNKCTALEELDLSNFDMINVSSLNASSMFYSCTKLHTLRLDNCSNATINRIITSSNFPTSAIEGVTRTIYCKESEAAGLTPPTNWVFSYVTEEEPEVPEEPPTGDIPLYVPGEFQFNPEITEVRTMVDESHNDLSNMFSFCSNLVSVNTEDWDTSNVTNMREMFFSCSSLPTLDVSNFNTSKVNNMSYMFSGCNNLPSLDVSNFDTSNVTTMDKMFDGCSSLPSLDVSNWDTSKVTDMSMMFNYCYSLQSLDMSNWDTSNVTSMYWMFSYCSNLTSIGNVSNWDTGNVTDMSYMFSGCYNLTSLDISKWDTSNVTSMSNMFASCGLTSLDLSNWDISNVTSMNSMFSYCNSLQSLDISNWDASNVTSMNWMFDGCYSLTELHLDNCSNDTISKIINSSSFPTDATMDGTTRIIYCKKENKGDLVAPTNWVFSCDEPSTSLYVPGEFQYNMEITEVTTMVDESHDNLSSMFSSCMSLVSVNTEDWDTSNVTDMSYMFNGCHSLQSLDVSNWDTSNVTSMYWMFYGCASLTSLDVSNFNTGNVTNMNSMFNYCYSLTSLDLSSFDTSNVTDMSYMFSGCNLTSLDLSNWDTSNVTSMYNIFSYCYSLTSLDLSNWDASKVTDMSGIFDGCSSLTELRLDNCSYDTISKIITSSNFPTDIAMNGETRTIYCKKENAAGLTAPTNWVFSYVDEPSISLYVSGEFQNNKEITEVRTMVDESHYDLSYMFSGCSNLISVNTEDWDISSVYSMRSMFYECTSLTQLDLSNFNTAMVGFMSMMFYNCTSLTTLNLSNWDASGLFIPEMEMEGMFSGCNSLHTLRLDNCSNETINRIITLSYLPTNAIAGVTRTIYCKEANAAGLTPPTNWVFSYVD